MTTTLNGIEGVYHNGTYTPAYPSVQTQSDDTHTGTPAIAGAETPCLVASRESFVGI